MDLKNKLLNVEEFATAVGWKAATVRQKVWRRQIDFVRMGRSIRFKPETVQKLIERGTVPALERP
jgi:excisionase family DNA binding protein